MNERLNLTEEEMSLLRGIEGGHNRAADRPALQRLMSLGLAAGMRLGRSNAFGVSITHKGRRVALGMAPEQGDDE